MPKKNEKPSNNRKKRLVVLLLGPAVILLAGGYFYVTGQRYATTDNAYLKSDKTSIAAEVSGKAVQVNILDNQPVTKGETLLVVDPEHYRIVVQQAEAKLADVRTEIESLRADYLQKSAELAKMEENMRYWEKENQRYQALLKTTAVAATKVDEVKHEWQSAIEENASTKQELASVLARLGGKPDITVEDHPSYKQALAELNKARLDLERTEVKSPLTGTASNVTLEKGEYIAAGLPLFSVVNDKYLWIEANFKETDLTYVRPGQKATVEIDTFPGRKWPATVASITPATGAEFSLLPPQNASGNWVKVVQRVMVRLEFDDKNTLPPAVAGMSTHVSIDTGHSRLGRWSRAR